MKKITIEEILFFAFFILLSITKGLGFYEGQKMFQLLILPAFVCAVLKIAISSYTKRQWITQVILLALTALVYYESREKGILFMMFLILGMKNISVKKVFHVGLWVWSVCAIVLSITSFYRLEDTIYRVHSKMGMGHIFRWSLGFTHPNILHITYLALCAFIVYELAEKYHFKHFVLLMIGNVLVFFFSISYTGFGIVAILLVGMLYVKIRPKFCLLEKMAVNMILPAIMVVSFVLPIILYTPWVQKLNFMLNTRLYLARQFLVPEYMSLFGVRIADVVQSSMTMDNSFIWGFINYGIIPFVLLMLAYFVLIANYSWKQKTRELVIIICFMGAGFTEPLLFNTSFKNITLVFLGELLFRQKEGAKEYCLFPQLQKEVELPFGAFVEQIWLRVKNVWKSYKKQLAAGVLVGAVLGGVLCGIFYTVPEGYVVQRFYTDGLHETSVYLESEDDVAYEGYKVMNYVDAETPMQVIDGKAVTLETARYYVGSIIIGGFVGWLLATSGLFWKARKRVKTSK
ncbi:MAG: hypothetical protein IJO97_06340 [Lachnospiraceae bacterium]|nr:hypothetical protein [Lachnospiraceae bacterium]